jgi:hypothetical protein
LPPLPAPADNAAMEAEPIKGEPPKRKRRWFQFSLRTLMIFTAVVAVGCGWLATKIEKKRREQQTIELILSKGGHIGFDYQRVDDLDGFILGKAWHIGGEPSAPRWLQSIFGENFFSEVQFVYFDRENSASWTDAEMENLKYLSQLEELQLREVQVSDAEIKELQKALPNCHIDR